jgi:2-polyprenyl-6-hydroxyphenyl methylase/3-demethylubiquinone-9 3-methyltransferase
MIHREISPMKINNEMYFQEDLQWWDEGDDSPYAFLRHIINPLRFAYFNRIMNENPSEEGSSKTLLDVGCGGGFLSEEFAKTGCDVTGMDPSPVQVKAGREHATENSLSINYIEGYGEKISLDDDCCDYVACCDVLEHVDDVDKVISEISRVLKPGGVFFYDTINRTLASYLLVIKIAEGWKFTAWQPKTHVWNKFIRPAELINAMKKHGLLNQEIKGISPGNNLVQNFLKVRRRAQGKISCREMGAGLKLHESGDTSVSYMGFAQKE